MVSTKESIQKPIETLQEFEADVVHMVKKLVSNNLGRCLEELGNKPVLQQTSVRRNITDSVVGPYKNAKRRIDAVL